MKDDLNNNDAWKVSLVPIAYGIPSLGQFHNNKPLKGISLMAVKSYWYKLKRVFTRKKSSDEEKESNSSK